MVNNNNNNNFSNYGLNAGNQLEKQRRAQRNGNHAKPSAEPRRAAAAGGEPTQADIRNTDIS